MGVLSSKYKFHLNRQDWCVHVRMRLFKSLVTYKITIDDQLVSDTQSGHTSVEMISPHEVEYTHDGQDYKALIAPVSHWGYGVHVHQDGHAVYKYKGKDFADLKTLKTVSAQIDGLQSPSRPFWKHILEAAIIGAGVGVTYGLSMHLAKNAGWVSPDADFSNWVIAITVGFILFRPSRFAFIK